MSASSLEPSGTPAAPPLLPPRWLVVMGVSGCGKSSLGQALAASLGLLLIEGDDFHSPASVAKMAAGKPLDDDDRRGWLDRLSAQLASRAAGCVLTCSALKRGYRDRLRGARAGLRFVHMVIARDVALQRVATRHGHHFPPSLVDSQFATLESPAGEPGVLEVDATVPIAALVDRVVHWLAEADTDERGGDASA